MSIQLTESQIAINIEALTTANTIARNVAAMVKNDYLLFCQGSAEAGAGIVAFWNACEENGFLAKVRTQLSEAAKQVHADLGINVGKGAKVENGEIVLASNRNKKSKNPLVEKATELAKEMSEENQKKLAALLSEAAKSL